jgi:Cys-tRNA(Pro)/Cys-tRNA(Cys) deacylase
MSIRSPIRVSTGLAASPSVRRDDGSNHSGFREPRKRTAAHAAAFAGKAANMMRPADAERLTGYHVGGISPFAQKKRVPVAIDQAALAETSAYLNGGQRGLQIELDPNDAIRALDATVQPLTG